jgi:hypothetical protein
MYGDVWPFGNCGAFSSICQYRNHIEAMRASMPPKNSSVGQR